VWGRHSAAAHWVSTPRPLNHLNGAHFARRSLVGSVVHPDLTLLASRRHLARAGICWHWQAAPCQHREHYHDAGDRQHVCLHPRTIRLFYSILAGGQTPSSATPSKTFGAFPNDCVDPKPIEHTEWVVQPETPEEAAEMLAVLDRDLE
jgi:hypothetical protein